MMYLQNRDIRWIGHADSGFVPMSSSQGDNDFFDVCILYTNLIGAGSKKSYCLHISIFVYNKQSALST